jgi:hypothetical protein
MREGKKIRTMRGEEMTIYNKITHMIAEAKILKAQAVTREAESLMDDLVIVLEKTRSGIGDELGESEYNQDAGFTARDRKIAELIKNAILIGDKKREFADWLRTFWAKGKTDAEIQDAESWELVEHYDHCRG